MKALKDVENKKPVYEILGLEKGSSKEEIEATFRNWIRSHHPDAYRDDVLKKQANAVLQYLNQHLRPTK